MKVVVVGTGTVGKALGTGFKKHGYEVTLANRDGKKVEGWDGAVGNLMDVVGSADLVVLAVKGSAAEGLVKAIDGLLKGKTVIDVCNPISDVAPTNGVLGYFTSYDNSLLERLQKAAPEAHFVKAFNSVGAAYMVNPDFGGVKPTMFICGNDANAKKEVGKILDQFGWETADMGMVEAARAIEPLCMLWCIPGIAANDWSPRAFKLLKK